MCGVWKGRGGRQKEKYKKFEKPQENSILGIEPDLEKESYENYGYWERIHAG
jgi:hypothetical protein